MSSVSITKITVDNIEVETTKTSTPVPFVKHTTQPTFRWLVENPGSVSVVFDIDLYWDGARDGSGDPIYSSQLEFSKENVVKLYYTMRAVDALQHATVKYAGGDYRIKITARYGVSDTDELEGWFRINHPPGMPTGLRII